MRRIKTIRGVSLAEQFDEGVCPVILNQVKGKPCEGERMLMLEVLRDALYIYEKHCSRAISVRQNFCRKRNLFWEAHRWFFKNSGGCVGEKNQRWLYEFSVICDYLGIDRDRILRMLKKWRAQQFAQCPDESVVMRSDPLHRRKRPSIF